MAVATMTRKARSTTRKAKDIRAEEESLLISKAL